jgi:hypothetical protein
MPILCTKIERNDRKQDQGTIEFLFYVSKAGIEKRPNIVCLGYCL